MTNSNDISSQAFEPQAAYGSFTPAETSIMQGLVQLRGHDDLIHRIELLVHKSLKKLKSDDDEIEQKLAALKSLSGSLAPYDTGEDYKELLAKALKEKYGLPDNPA